MSVNIGQTAETKACNYLKLNGYKIMARNWRTRYCEIDIIAKKHDCIYFVEVKYRKNTEQGSGLEYITKSKLKQMQFSAQLWVHQNNWQGDYQLSAIEVGGFDFRVKDFVEDCSI